jgi:hypothetical protein
MGVMWMGKGGALDRGVVREGELHTNCSEKRRIQKCALVEINGIHAGKNDNVACRDWRV